MAEISPETVQRYEEALASLVEKARQDPYVLAVILLGSLSYDVVWERSDIDLCIVVEEGKLRTKSLSLVEEGVNIHAALTTRGEFKRILEGSLQSGFMHSYLSKGKIVYSRDETLDALFAQRMKLGERDRAARLLGLATMLIWSLVKARKWLDVKHDPIYSFFWIMKSLDSTAGIEVVWHGEIPSREVVHQALRLNPSFFGEVYTGLISGGARTEEAVGEALSAIEGYLIEKTPTLFAPIFEYLAEASGPRSASEITEYFNANLRVEAADAACEWLADQGLIDKVPLPVRLTQRSRVDFDEAAYHYDGERRA